MNKRHVTISITPDILRRAVRQGCYDCALALALREATGLDWHACEDSARIMTLRGRKPVWKYPPEVRRFVAAFDRGEQVEPVTFKLPARFADRERWADLGAVQ